jgi:hypothetical protein
MFNNYNVTFLNLVNYSLNKKIANYKLYSKLYINVPRRSGGILAKYVEDDRCEPEIQVTLFVL